MGEASERIERALAKRLKTLDELDATLELDPRQTIRPGMSTDATLHSGVRPRAAAPTSEAAWLAPAQPLQLQETIGEGGMGMVHLGVQRTLGRRVAVKAIKPGLRSAETVAKLISEARVTGFLEHPNVVPVHEIATDAQGCPLIILKRIEGMHWGELLEDPDELKRRFDADDPLEWHLRVLMQVCNAVHFAHSRGILHRDLKPENVMVGEFGEVYVLDWGLAVRLGEGDPDLEGDDLPRATDAVRMAGTPSYMAPEMLGGEPPRLDARTDVYLLGAILYEILTGQPPHRGETLMQVLVSVSKSTPPVPEGAPEELAAIVRRALSRHREDRFASAEELRHALEDFLRHRGAVRLAEAAERTLAALEAAPTVEDAQARYAECRFGFSLALEQWPQSARATDGLDRATALMAERLADDDDPRAADRLLRQMQAPPAELRARVDAALAEQRGARDELARVRRELDPRFGRRVRVVASVVLGVWWTLGPLVGGWLGQYGHDVWSLAGPPALLLPVFAAATWWLRDVALRTVLNRQLLGAAALVMIAELSVHVGGALGGLAPAETHAIALVIFAIVTASMGLMVSPLLFVPAGTYLAAFLVAIVSPQWRFWAQATGNLVMTIAVLRVWILARHPLALATEGAPTEPGQGGG